MTMRNKLTIVPKLATAKQQRERWNFTVKTHRSRRLIGRTIFFHKWEMMVQAFSHLVRITKMALRFVDAAGFVDLIL